MSFKVAKSQCLDFSPTFDSRGSRGDKENSKSIPALSLLQFSRSPFLSFGTLKLGSTKSLQLEIENPTEYAITVSVDKLPASKGFSVDQTTFTIRPEDSFILTVTWIPVDEGGVRELLCFVANGLVKHQAILLGKAVCTKKKKKTLWDSIKKKGVPAYSRDKSLPVKSVNKTFHVSRQSRYRKERRSNPLSSLNHESAGDSRCVRNKAALSSPELSKCTYVTETFSADHLQKNSPVVVLVPSEKLVELNTPGCEEVRRDLHSTLSPSCTQEIFEDPPSLCFKPSRPGVGQTVHCDTKEQESNAIEKPCVSVSDALVLIGSDLGDMVSQPNACSSYDFSDSLESEKLNSDSIPEVSFQATGIIEPPVEAPLPDPRLTYCVKTSGILAPLTHKLVTFSTGTVTKSKKDSECVIPHCHVPVNSATVTKGKPEHVDDNSGLLKKKPSRRRLLEKTLDLPNSSFVEPNTSCSESLPLIPLDMSEDLAYSTRPEVLTSSKSQSNHLHSTSSPAKLDVLPPDSTAQSSRLGFEFYSLSDKTQPSLSQDQFPVQTRTLIQTKKRKSDEFQTNQSEEVSHVQTKKSRVFSDSSSSKNTIQVKKPRPGELRSAIASSNSRKQAKPKDARQSVKSLGSSTRKSAKIVAVAQTKLTFIRPSQTAIPRHPLPFAAKNMFYDERWIEKQESGFSWWMNYVLTPDDFKVATEVTKVNALTITMGNNKFNIPKAPTKEEMSFKTYTARQRLNRLRRTACKLFTSDSMVKGIRRLELEIEAKRLLVRKDRHLWKDIGERQKVLNWLMSYNPLWLRIGLETIYGELISLEGNNDVMGLAMFILSRLLWNPEMASEYRHAKVPNLYRDGHEEALSRFTLKKLILLVCFLDKAKESRLIEHDPCLFCMDAEFKSSKDLLLAFARDFLSGEGILPRHVGLLGLPVSHIQNPLDEFNFGVKNLSVDLKCGIRLVRVMELFTQDWTLSRKLRVPAVSRLQKVHNVDVALQVLKGRGVDLKDERGASIDARDIVDGHREKTLNLLWKIIFCFQVEVLLDENQLKDEISFLRKAWRTKRQLASLMTHNAVPVIRTKSKAYENPSQKVALLMDWVNAVCEFYNLKAENFTVSFSDGRVLCYLIHHYHPGHLPAERVQQKTTQTIECGRRGRVELNNSSSGSDCSFEEFPSLRTDSEMMDFKKLLENERSNFQLVNAAVSNLGGVPAMINPEDMSNTIPNEKVVMCYLSFLCKRLLDLRNEARASRVIQSAWRRYKLQKEIGLIQHKYQAASKIQALVRMFIVRRRMMRAKKAAIMIQTAWRGHFSREMLKTLKQERDFVIQKKAATVIQKCFRAWRVQNLIKKNRAASVIQGAFQKWHVRKMLERNDAALRIQSWFKMQRCRTKYLDLQKKAIRIQSWFKGQQQKRMFRTLKKRHDASITIQSAFRGYLVRRHICKMEMNAVVIQRWFRACMLRNTELKNYSVLKSAVITLQAAIRGWKVRQTVALQHHAVLIIQTSFRRFLTRRRFQCLKRSAIVVQQRYRAKRLGGELRQRYLDLKGASMAIQAVWRGRAERKSIRRLHTCARTIQSHYRRFVAQREFCKAKKAAIVIRRTYRAFKVGQKLHMDYTKRKRAAIVLQSVYRGWKARRELQRKNQAAVVIQSYVRARLSRQSFLNLKCSALVIQQRYRAFKIGRNHRVQYDLLRRSTLTLQATYRGMKVRQDLRRAHLAATTIQAQFRSRKVRANFLAEKRAAVIIQQRYRAYTTGKCIRADYLKMKKASVVIQALFRGMKDRKRIQRYQQAATIIQSHFRGNSQLKKFQRQRWAASVIQQRFRAAMAKNAAVEQFLAQKNAALRIQSVFRGYVVRKQIAELHKSAKVIQWTFRAYKLRCRYLALKKATVRIQQQYRATVSQRKERQRYNTVKNAIITLQSAFRGMRVRKDVRRRHEMATLIQAKYRMYRLRVPFQVMKLAAVIIQRHYRSHLLRQETREGFIKLRHSAIVFQAVYRGRLARKELARMQYSATVIQRQYHTYKKRRQFLRIRSAVQFCQRHYRSLLVAQKVHGEYLAKRQAVVTIQANFRGMQVRRQLRRRHEAATIIQSNTRKLICKSHLQRLRWAARTIQDRFRANREMRREMTVLGERKKAALTLQAAYRGMKSRQTLRKRHQAATVIQKTFRAFSFRTRYLAMKYAAVVIQQVYRSWTAAKRLQKQFLGMRHGAIVLQAHFRGYQVRKKLLEQRQAAILIQSHFRRHKEKVKFQAMKLSAVVIQSHYRSCVHTRLDRQRYLRLRKSTITIQAAFRGFSLRRRLKEMKEASVVIQRAVRMYQQRSAFRRYCWAAKVFQQRYRALRLKNQAANKYQKIRNATLCLQKFIRGMKGRKLAKRTKAARTIQSYFRMSVQRQRYVKERSAAIVIQSAYRGHSIRVHYAKIQASGALIQKWYRSCKQTKRDRNEFVALKQATTTLQSAFRGKLARNLAKRKRAAIKIQSLLRMHVHRKRYVQLRSCVLKLQARYKTRVAQRTYVQMRSAAVLLQKHYRSHRAKTEQRRHYLKTLQSIRLLQARTRGFLQYRRFQRLRRSAVIIQASYRALIERRKFVLLKKSVCTIEKHYRAFRLCQKERAKFLLLRKSAVCVQTAFRDYQKRLQAKTTQAALKIQACYRGHRARRQYRSRRVALATVIRCIQTRRLHARFRAVQRCAQVIQRRWRETLSARKCRAHFLDMRKSATCFQSFWRGRMVRDSVHKKTIAAVKIQSIFRCFIQRRRFNQQRVATMMIQRRFRALQLFRVEEENRRRRHNAAVRLQALCRGWLERQKLKEAASATRRLHFAAAVHHHLSAIRIQRVVRAHLALKSAQKQISLVLYIQRRFRAKMQRRQYLRERESIIKIQRAAKARVHRRIRAAAVIQRCFRKLLLKRRVEKLQRGVMKMQALWRGHRSRKCSDTSRVVSLRHRLRELHQGVKEEDKLGNKTTTALQYLLNYKNYAHILAALKHLESATRLSPECCERLVESGATQSIFTLIRSCNRSLPSMEIITLSIKVLLNLSKYHRTIDAVYAVENSVETLLDLLQIYREKAGEKNSAKGGSIFTNACFMMLLLVQDERRAMEVRQMPKAADHIRSILRLTRRKFKMDAERTHVKQKMNASVNGSFLQATPRKSRPVARFAPYWVLRRDTVKDVVDPLGAIEMLANALALAL